MNQERLLKIIQAPHVSEKAMLATQNRNEYVLRVCKDAKKPEIKKAVETLFKTLVTAVRIVNVKTKPKRFGAISGSSKAWKKAYITLQADQKLDFGVEK